MNDKKNEKMEPVIMLTEGFCMAIACVSNEVPPDEIAAHCPISGTRHGWDVSEDETDSAGNPNPMPCPEHPKTRKHYLLEC